MIAAVAFEGLEFPDQKALDWTEFESMQWLRANQQYFNKDNGVYYDTGSITNVCSLPNNGLRFATIASNGKIYGGQDVGTYVVIFDPTTDTAISSSVGTNLRSFGAFNSPFTEKIYISGGPNGSLNLTTIDTTTDTVSYNVTGSIPEAAWYPVCPALDGRYAYGPTRPDRDVFRIGLLDDGLDDMVAGPISGDHNVGALAWNNEQWHTLGGNGANGFLIFDNTTETLIQQNWNDGLSSGFVNDGYRNIVQHPNGFMYSIGFASPYNILKIEPNSRSIQIIGQAPAQYSWTVHELMYDGKIMFCGGNTIGVFDPVTETLATFSAPSSNIEACVTSLEGDMYLFSGNFASIDAIFKIPLVGKEKIKSLLNGNHIAGRFRANY